jgi:hypothetical protein
VMSPGGGSCPCSENMPKRPANGADQVRADASAAVLDRPNSAPMSSRRLLARRSLTPPNQ